MKLLIVDTDSAGRMELIRLCQGSEALHVVGEAASGASAIDAVVKYDPELLLLNAELPDMTGVDLLKALQGTNAPPGIMIANRGESAVDAFAEGAIDYLMKPVTPERFQKAILRARRHIYSASQAPLSGAISAGPSTPEHTVPPTFLVGERQRRLYPLEPHLIDYIEVDRNYVTLRSGKVEYISRDSVARLSVVLAELGFIRIERSVLMNIRAVSYAETAGHGTFAFTLRSGVCLHSSAAYRGTILRALPLPAMSKRNRPAPLSQA